MQNVVHVKLNSESETEDRVGDEELEEIEKNALLFVMTWSKLSKMTFNVVVLGEF